MKVFRFNEKALGRASSLKSAVVIVAPNIADSKAASIKERFPNSLVIAEVLKGTPARDGFFSVLRIHIDELADFDYDLKGCKAMLVEGVSGMFLSELLRYREELSEKAGLAPASTILIKADNFSEDCLVPPNKAYRTLPASKVFKYNLKHALICLTSVSGP